MGRALVYVILMLFAIAAVAVFVPLIVKAVMRKDGPVEPPIKIVKKDREEIK